MKPSKKILLLSYTLLLIAILAYPLRTIQRIEFPAAKPLEVKFSVTLSDPYDPMRGRFVRLKVLPDEYRMPEKIADFKWRAPLYAVIAGEPDGMAKIVRMETDPGKIHADEYFVRLESAWESYSSQPQKGEKEHVVYQIQFPFKKFYLNELKAPGVEHALTGKNAEQHFRLKVRIFPGGFWAVSGLENKNQ